MSVKKTKESLAQDIKIVLNQAASELSLLEYMSLLTEVSLEVMNRSVAAPEFKSIVNVVPNQTTEVKS